ncbi:MAG TPA: HepT-like ribonuclease domain-containing protein [Pyrinomonadaceae bacterium]|nr:HepT-like ribonuclease domain-containing protein [Pyrinomonadaceae bacterium]
MPAGCSLYPWLNPIEIIGEAASRVSPACQAKYAGIPWPEIIGMRNRLIHAYFDINLDIVWRTITEELPPLVAELEKALSSGEAE